MKELRRGPAIDARLFAFHDGKQVKFPVADEFDTPLHLLSGDPHRFNRLELAGLDDEDPNLKSGVVMNPAGEIDADTDDILNNDDDDEATGDDSFFFA